MANMFVVFEYLVVRMLTVLWKQFKMLKSFLEKQDGCTNFITNRLSQ